MGLGEASVDSDGKGKGIIRNKEERRHASRSQLLAQEAAYSYKDHVPLAIRLEIY